MWIDYKKVDNLSIAETYKNLLEAAEERTYTQVVLMVLYLMLEKLQLLRLKKEICLMYLL